MQQTTSYLAARGSLSPTHPVVPESRGERSTSRKGSIQGHSGLRAHCARQLSSLGKLPTAARKEVSSSFPIAVHYSSPRPTACRFSAAQGTPILQLKSLPALLSTKEERCSRCPPNHPSKPRPCPASCRCWAHGLRPPLPSLSPL